MFTAVALHVVVIIADIWLVAYLHSVSPKWMELPLLFTAAIIMVGTIVHAIIYEPKKKE